MDGRSDTLRRALEALAEVCGPLSVEPEKRSRTEAELKPEQDHKAWADDFRQWMGERCTPRRAREDWAGVGALLVDFAEWSVNRGEVPCSRNTLEKLLGDAGFVVVNGMVRGLVLNADLLAIVPNVSVGQPRTTRRSI